MQRKRSSNTRLANSQEKAFMAWTKESPCIACGNWPCIIDHAEGSTKKVYVGPERVLIGHWWILPLCQQCDEIKTKGSRKAFREARGDQAQLWMDHASNYPGEIPDIVRAAIKQEIKDATK